MSKLTLDFEDKLTKDLQAFVSQKTNRQITADLLQDFLYSRQRDDMTAHTPIKSLW